MNNDNGSQFYYEVGEFIKYNTLLNELNNHPIRTNQDANIQYYHTLCERVETIKTDYINKMINLHQIQVISDVVFKKSLDPLLPKCCFNNKTKIFNMDFNFVPYLKIGYLKKCVKIKNALIYLIMEGIKRMQEKPNYKEPVLIIFSIFKPYLFDVDNIEIKYIIDAMRYSHFFLDDSYNYVSYLVEGKDTKKDSHMTVKIIKKVL